LFHNRIHGRTADDGVFEGRRIKGAVIYRRLVRLLTQRVRLENQVNLCPQLVGEYPRELVGLAILIDASEQGPVRCAELSEEVLHALPLLQSLVARFLRSRERNGRGLRPAIQKNALHPLAG
jgi:hypothetical protein